MFIFLLLLVGRPALVVGSDCGGCWCINGSNPCPLWEPQTNWTPDEINALASQECLNPFSLNCDPYSDENCSTSPPQTQVTNPNAVCGLVYSDPSCESYTLQTFGSREEAVKNGAWVTHLTACGTCSTTQDLSVYLNYQDLTQEGTKCGTLGLISPDRGLQCFLDLGFTLGCANIWNYNALFDSSVCGQVCFENVGQPYNGPPPLCELNDCLQCDEDNAGPNFKSFAGRTRRNSGTESAIARPCDTVARINQKVCPAATTRKRIQK